MNAIKQFNHVAPLDMDFGANVIELNGSNSDNIKSRKNALTILKLFGLGDGSYNHPGWPLCQNIFKVCF